MRGFSPLEAGLSTIPLAFVSFLVAPRAGEMVGRIGTETSYYALMVFQCWLLAFTIICN